ncbi:hypothetical protein F4811DRAFT_184847 [Daldinia bambusicola]|nr:hypothetical protein F4811DRAFT_184847 [Daldinia bambusicola]
MVNFVSFFFLVLPNVQFIYPPILPILPLHKNERDNRRRNNSNYIRVILVVYFSFLNALSANLNLPVQYPSRFIYPCFQLIHQQNSTVKLTPLYRFHSPDCPENESALGIGCKLHMQHLYV